MPTLKEWEDNIKEQDIRLMEECHKSLMTLEKWGFFHGALKEYGLWIVAQELRTFMCRHHRAYCDGCGSDYLRSGDWSVRDLIEVPESRYYKRRQYCPNCYDGKIEEGLINPEKE